MYQCFSNGQKIEKICESMLLLTENIFVFPLPPSLSNSMPSISSWQDSMFPFGLSPSPKTQSQWFAFCVIFSFTKFIAVYSTTRHEVGIHRTRTNCACKHPPRHPPRRLGGRRSRRIWGASGRQTLRILLQRLLRRSPFH